MRPVIFLRQSLICIALALVSLSASAEALIIVCYNWGCQERQVISFSEPWLGKALQPLSQAKTPEAERAAVAEVVHRFYKKAAEQSPIGADEPGNNEDVSVIGRMDCIDHSTTTKNILSFLELRKQLRWHHVGPYAHRSLLVASHYSATLIEKDSNASNASEDNRIFTVDPWDVEPEALPAVISVREWAGPRFYSFETQHHTQNTLAALNRGAN